MLEESYFVPPNSRRRNEFVKEGETVFQFSMIKDPSLIPEKQSKKSQVHVGLYLALTPIPPKHHQRCTVLNIFSIFSELIKSFNIHKHSKCFPKS